MFFMLIYVLYIMMMIKFKFCLVSNTYSSLNKCDTVSRLFSVGISHSTSTQ